MRAYRKLPVVIDAVQVDDANFTEIMGMDRSDGLIRVIWENDHILGVDLTTLEGIMHASIGDWIIRGIKGEIYPCKPDIFEATYEPV